MIVLLIIVIALWAYGSLLNRERNPYIKTHKAKIKIDKDYSDYLKWADKQNEDIVIDKVQFKEDVQVMNEVDKMLKSKL